VKQVTWSAYIMLESRRLKKVIFVTDSNLREDAVQRCKSLYGVHEVRTLTRLWN